MGERAGPEPDSRFTQANDRTFLAWIRTSLALVTFGFVISRLGIWLNAMAPDHQEVGAPFSSAFLGACFVVLALIVDVLALLRYRHVVRALREGRPVSLDRLPMLFGVMAIALAALVAIYTFTAVL